MLLSCLDGLENDIRCGGAEGGEDTAGVEPLGTAIAEDFFPVDVAGFQLAGGGVATVRAADGATCGWRSGECS